MMNLKLCRRNMANIITCCRIVCSILMIFFHMPSTPFYILYMICGLSDVLDGIIARKTNTASSFGARLDTIAGVKIANIIFGVVCTKRLIVEHTLLNKITGVLLFLLPLTLFWINFKYSAMVVCVVATFAAIQEGYYIRKGREIV